MRPTGLLSAVTSKKTFGLAIFWLFVAFAWVENVFGRGTGNVGCNDRRDGFLCPTVFTSVWGDGDDDDDDGNGGAVGVIVLYSERQLD